MSDMSLSEDFGIEQPIKKFETKDSGQRQEYKSGMKRDLQDGKPRFDLLTPHN